MFARLSPQSVSMAIVAMFLCGVSIACGQSKGVETSPMEVSGITVHRDVTQEGSPVIFSVVSDEMDGRLFKNFLKHLPEPGQLKSFPARALRVSLAKELEKQAKDLEDIGVLNDRLVVLSEDHAKLVSEDAVVADYSGIEKLREVDNKHGLEGLAIRAKKDGTSRVAVLWEGYVDKKDDAHAPRVYIHEMTPTTPKPFVATEENGKLVKLAYQDLLSQTGEKKGTNLRAPALVWTKLPDDKWGFIVLVTVDEKDRWDRKWLLRFDDEGHPIGKAIPFTDLGMSQQQAGKNWEGMCWSADEKSLIFVNDAKDGTLLYCAAKPTGW